MRRHKGVTLVELLGAIVIFSIATTLVALTITFILNANKDIIENGQANTTGTLIIRQIENKINDLFITDYTYVENDALILYSDYEYIYDSEINDIVLITHDPRLDLSIAFSNNQILVDDTPLDLSIFSLHESSQIVEMTGTSSTQFIITIVLETNGNLYTYKTNFEINS